MEINFPGMIIIAAVISAAQLMVVQSRFMITKHHHTIILACRYGMTTFKEFLGQEKTADKIVVKFQNSPTKMAPKFLFENLQSIEEGKTKNWGKGYSYRIDRRPANMGGDQIHIFNRQNQAWAYRDNGMKSEPNKYTSKATNIVKDIVSDIFKITPSNIEEALIIKATEEAIIIEVKFV